MRGIGCENGNMVNWIQKKDRPPERVTKESGKTRQEKSDGECGREPREKKPAPTVDRGGRLDNCGSAERRRGITSLRLENSSSRIGTCVMD